MKVRMLVVQGKPHGKTLLFPLGEFVFGRGEECHVRPNSDWVSRQHCLLRVTTGDASIRDLGSRNGTLVNGERVLGERRLSNGDQIQVGPLVFDVTLEETITLTDAAIPTLGSSQSHVPLPKPETIEMIELRPKTEEP